MACVPQDLPREIAKVAQFLGRELPEAVLDTITRHTSFEAMRDNPTTNYSKVPSDLMDHGVSPFMRKGERLRGASGALSPRPLLSPISPGHRHHRRLEEPLHRSPERAL